MLRTGRKLMILEFDGFKSKYIVNILFLGLYIFLFAKDFKKP